MITFSKIKSATLESGKRILKVLQFGIKTADEVSSYGDDANPLKGMTAVYSSTSEAGEQIIIGYINTNQVSKEGEKRIYSQKNDGSISFYIYLKNDGTMEFGGNTDNLVRYSPLDSSLQGQAADINTELGKIAAAIAGVGGTYTVAPIIIDNSAAKIEEAESL